MDKMHTWAIKIEVRVEVDAITKDEAIAKMDKRYNGLARIKGIMRDGLDYGE